MSIIEARVNTNGLLQEAQRTVPLGMGAKLHLFR